MALVEGCRHRLEITIPAAAFQAETANALEKVRQKVHLKGFRPGKAPAAIIRQHYMGEIRQEALDKLIPEYLKQAYDRQNLQVVSRPEVKDLEYKESGEVCFKAELEVAPEFELGTYRGVEVAYAEPQVSEDDISARIETAPRIQGRVRQYRPASGPGGRLLPGHSRVDRRARGRTDETGRHQHRDRR